MNHAGIRLGDWVSIGRIALSFLFVVLFRAHPGAMLTASIVIAALAQISDHLDGYLVRRMSAPSVKGWLFDSVADRAFYIAAILAFQREYGASEIAAWLFIMREVILYAVRVVSGEFESNARRYRNRAIFHAAIIRVAIVIGCLAPLPMMPSLVRDNASLILSALIGLSAGFGYWFLIFLVMPPRLHIERP
jgi:phosphatidylglycerophosphate synthase